MESDKPIRLQPRFQAVVKQIWVRIHADIGSNHALLPKYLLQGVIVVEKSAALYERSGHALESLRAEVYLGDGLGPLRVGEVESLRLSGMGTWGMLGILARHPERVPTWLVLQPKDSVEPLRRCRGTGFHLAHEVMVEGFWRYTVLSLERWAGPDLASRPIADCRRQRPCATVPCCCARNSRPSASTSRC